MPWKDLKLDQRSAEECDRLSAEIIHRKLQDEAWQNLEELWRQNMPANKVCNHLFSTIDCAYLAAWEDAGIPDEAVLIGIERTLARHRGPRPIRSLTYCEPEIYKAWKEYRDRQNGPHRRPWKASDEPGPPHQKAKET